MEFKISRTSCCMLIHERNLFYIDFIMIKLVSQEILLNYIVQVILCFFFNLYLNKSYYQKCANKLFHFNNK